MSEQDSTCAPLVLSNDADSIPQCAGVYEIRNDRHGIRYIGSSSNLRRRWKFHLYCFRVGKHHSKRMQRTHDKYGVEIFSFHILEIVDANKRLEVEQAWLDRTKAASRRDFYNSTPTAGSNLGFTVSEATRKKMSKAQKGRTFSDEARELMRAAKLGKEQSEEHKRNAAAARIGKKLPRRTEEWKQRFRKLTPDQLIEFRQLRRDGWRLIDLASRYGIGISTAHRITTGESYA